MFALKYVHLNQKHTFSQSVPYICIHQSMITLDDIRNGLALGARLSQLETAAHVSFILEGAISPTLDKTDRVTLKLKHGATENERLFIQAITCTLTLKASGKSFPTIDRFKRDCALYLCPKQAYKAKANGESSMSEFPPLRSGVALDDNKTMVQAEARSHGADFLFPQNTHDKVGVVHFKHCSNFVHIAMTGCNVTLSSAAHLGFWYPLALTLPQLTLTQSLILTHTVTPTL